MSNNVDVIRQVFRAVEGRDVEALFDLYHPEVEFHDAPSLPYGGSVRGRETLRAQLTGEGSWLATWGPLQPTEAERRMDPRVVAAADDEVVVLYRQRGKDAAGRRFDGAVLGLYRVSEGKLARAQMFHFDTAVVAGFLAAAKG